MKQWLLINFKHIAGEAMFPNSQDWAIQQDQEKCQWDFYLYSGMADQLSQAG